jgi:CRISPR/Cas system Type II protein with McrA/HNH and RuvC-like nuclease domain
MYGKIITCLRCGKKVYRKGNAKFCPECVKENVLIYKETKEVGKWVIFSRDEFRCVYCGKSSIEDGVKLELDHIVPYIDSEDNSIYNLITTCSDCNMHKGATHLSQSVYERIIKKNIERTRGISIKKQEGLNVLFHKYYDLYKRLYHERAIIDNDSLGSVD